MITVRRSKDRGHADHGWLDTYHTFSFASYQDRKHMHFSDLRVMNEDVVAPGRGFSTHEHDNMEIVTYVLSGELAHRDSLGSTEVLRPGEVQRMSAGSGIAHSEFNPSRTEPVHLLQIWLFPAEENTTPSYEQKAFPIKEEPNRLHLLVSPGGENGSLKIGQDTRLFGGTIEAGRSVQHALAPGRSAWVQMARGSATVNGTDLAQGDGAAITDEQKLQITAKDNAEVLLFDLR